MGVTCCRANTATQPSEHHRQHHQRQHHEHDQRVARTESLPPTVPPLATLDEVKPEAQCLVGPSPPTSEAPTIAKEQRSTRVVFVPPSHEEASGLVESATESSSHATSSSASYSPPSRTSGEVPPAAAETNVTPGRSCNTAAQRNPSLSFGERGVVVGAAGSEFTEQSPVQRGGGGDNSGSMVSPQLTARSTSDFLALAPFQSAGATLLVPSVATLRSPLRACDAQPSMGEFREDSSMHPVAVSSAVPLEGSLSAADNPFGVPRLVRVNHHRTFETSEQLASESTGWSFDATTAAAPNLYEIKLPAFHHASSGF
jgi:hypothetical protein